MPEKSGLGQLCTINNLVRTDYFSNTYRATFAVGDEETEWDIIHISLPFAPLKEKQLMARFGLEPKDLEAYYSDFGRCVKNLIATANHLDDMEVTSVLPLATYAIEKKDNARGSDIYLVTSPLSKFSIWDDESETSLSQIVALGTRLCQIIKGLNDVDDHMGIIDLDTTYSLHAHERDFTILGGFLYSSRDDGKSGVKLPSVVPAHCHPVLQEGEKASLATDVYSICSLLWSLLDGRHYTTAPDASKPPQFAEQELTDVLARGINEDNVYLSAAEMTDIVRAINKELHRYLKWLSSEAGKDADIIIKMALPTYDLSSANAAFRNQNT